MTWVKTFKVRIILAKKIVNINYLNKLIYEGSASFAKILDFVHVKLKAGSCSCNQGKSW